MLYVFPMISHESAKTSWAILQKNVKKKKSERIDKF